MSNSRQSPDFELFVCAFKPPYALPNLLVTRVAGIEALARALVMDVECANGQEKKERYGKFKKRDPQSLVVQYLKSHGIGSASEAFGKDTWDMFKTAVDARNLLIHECTFLGQTKFEPLEEACSQVFDKLIALAEL